MYPIETRTKFSLRSRLTCLCLIVCCLRALQNPALATTDVTAQETYIDSVYSWGAWELGIEPAAGPRSVVNKVINDRSKKIQFRPNDNAAYTAKRIPLSATTNISRPPPVPARPIAPAAPSIPIVRPDGSGPVMPGAVPTAPNRRR